MNRNVIRTSALALFIASTALYPAVASAGGDPAKPTACHSSQGVRVAPLDVREVNLNPVPSRHVTDDDIRAGIRAAGATPQAEAKLFPVVTHLVDRESGRNPNAVNEFDSVGSRDINAAARGAMQLFPAVFAENHVVGTSNSIKDPVANVAAGVTFAAMTYCIDLGTGENADALRRAHS